MTPPSPATKTSSGGLNQRARGWLKYLYEKVTEEGTEQWGSESQPGPKWDRWSLAPTCSFPRFDLHESTYAIALLADRMPAWREPFRR